VSLQIESCWWIPGLHVSLRCNASLFVFHRYRDRSPCKVFSLNIILEILVEIPVGGIGTQSTDIHLFIKSPVVAARQGSSTSPRRSPSACSLGHCSSVHIRRACQHPPWYEFAPRLQFSNHIISFWPMVRSYGAEGNNSFTGCRIWGSHSGGYEEFYFLGYNAV
jgi:hypothetical protein